MSRLPRLIWRATRVLLACLMLALATAPSSPRPWLEVAVCAAVFEQPRAPERALTRRAARVEHSVQAPQPERALQPAIRWAPGDNARPARTARLFLKNCALLC